MYSPSLARALNNITTNITTQQQALTSTSSGVATTGTLAGGLNYYSYGFPLSNTYNPFIFQTPNPNPSFLNIQQKREELNNQMEEYNKIKFTNDIVQGLHQSTVDVIVLVEQLSRSNDVEDLKKLDEYIKRMLFGNKLSSILSKEDQVIQKGDSDV